MDSVVLSAAGNINHKDLVEKVKKIIFNYNSNHGGSGSDSWGNSNNNSRGSRNEKSSDKIDNKGILREKLLKIKSNEENIQGQD